jgi:hypothetical protein
LYALAAAASLGAGVAAGAAVMLARVLPPLPVPQTLEM